MNSQKTNKQALKPRNTRYGFFGTYLMNCATKNVTRKQALKAHEQVSEMLLGQFGSLPKVTPNSVRDFLDSTAGRHLADAVTDTRGMPGPVRELPPWTRKSLARFLQSYRQEEFDTEYEDADDLED